MSKVMNLLIFGMFLFLVGTVSADFAVVGTVYDDIAGSGFVDGANVVITCGTTGTYTTGSDGTYAILFNDSECNETHSWSISVSKTGYDNFNGVSQAVDYSKMLNLSGLLYSTVVDFVLNKENSTSIINSGSSSGGNRRTCTDGVWECGNWTDCYGESQNRECISNCKTVKSETQSCVAEVAVEVEVDNESVSNIEFEDNAATEEEPNGFFSAITGAVTGITKTPQGIAAAAFIVLALFGFVAVRSKSKKVAE